jgi:hypothetical protein
MDDQQAAATGSRKWSSASAELLRRELLKRDSADEVIQPSPGSDMADDQHPLSVPAERPAGFRNRKARLVSANRKARSSRNRPTRPTACKDQLDSHLADLRLCPSRLHNRCTRVSRAPVTMKMT